MHCLWRLSTTVDEALGGYGKEIFVTLRPDGGIGAGTKAAVSRSTKSRGPACLGWRWSSPNCMRGKFGAGSYNATGGLHGVGSSVVNALSSRLDVEVDRNSATWAMSFPSWSPWDVRRAGQRRSSRRSSLRKIGRASRVRPAPG